MKRTSLALLGVVVAASIILIGVLLLMGQKPVPVVSNTGTTGHSADVSPTSFPAGDTAATIDGIPISYQDWQVATRLDAAMSHLTGQPIPTAEETLDRLVNETLLLRGADLEGADVGGDQVQDRIANLQTAWGLTPDDIAAALQSSGLDLDALEDRVARLILVEQAIQTLSDQHADLEAWLQQARESTQVSLLQPLDSTPTPQPTRPESEPIDQPTVEPTLYAESQSADDQAANLPTAPRPQSLAPDFRLTSLDEQMVQLGDLRGRPVLINFWATWCPACRQELPALQAAYERYGDQVAFVAIDVKESQSTVTKFISQFGLTFPVLLDEKGQVSDRLYQVRGIPTSLFVAPDGVVTARHVGPLTETDIDRYLTPLLANEPTQPQDKAANPAPDFTLPGAGGVTTTLSDFIDQSNVVLVFYRGYT